MVMHLYSSAFPEAGPIPERYTAEGANLSPPLDWENEPKGTKSYALIVEDPDTPDPAAPKRTWTHWVVYNIPAKTHQLVDGANFWALPKGTVQGYNDWQFCGYGGACPPIGEHRYIHKLYALDTLLPPLWHPDKRSLLEAMEGHVLAQTSYVGTYYRHH